MPDYIATSSDHDQARTTDSEPERHERAPAPKAAGAALAKPVPAGSTQPLPRGTSAAPARADSSNGGDSAAHSAQDSSSKPSGQVAADPGDVERSTLFRGTLNDSVKDAFKLGFEAMAAGIDLANAAIEKPDVEEDGGPIAKFLEIALDAAIAGSAEGIAAMAIEHVVVHLATELAHKEAFTETIKAALEGSAKSVTGHRNEHVDLKDLKEDYHRKALVQRIDLIKNFNAIWPTYASVLTMMPPEVAVSLATGLSSVPSGKMVSRVELSYLSAWLNFIACAYHGAAKENTGDKNAAVEEQSIDPDSIEMSKPRGWWQSPPELHGVLEVTNLAYNPHVYLDNVDKPTRVALRRLGREGEFSDLRLRELKMNMLVRDGNFGESPVDEIVVGPAGNILNHEKPSRSEYEMVKKAGDLPVSWIKKNQIDSDKDS